MAAFCEEENPFLWNHKGEKISWKEFEKFNGYYYFCHLKTHVWNYSTSIENTNTEKNCRKYKTGILLTTGYHHLLLFFTYLCSVFWLFHLEHVLVCIVKVIKEPRSNRTFRKALCILRNTSKKSKKKRCPGKSISADAQKNDCRKCPRNDDLLADRAVKLYFYVSRILETWKWSVTCLRHLRWQQVGFVVY